MDQNENKKAIRLTAQQTAFREKLNQRIEQAATRPVEDLLNSLHTSLRGLNEDTVSENRDMYGSNKVTREKQKSLAKRLAEAFINPFTAILFFLAIVSTMTDIVFLNPNTGEPDLLYDHT